MSRIAIKFWFTAFAIQTLSIIFAYTFSCSNVTNAACFITMVVAVTSATSLTCRGIAMTPGLTRLTKLSFCPVLTLIAPPNAGSTSRMIVTTAVYRAVRSGPP